VGGIDAAGIYDMEGAAVPFGFPEQAVTRGPGRVVHDGETLSDQSVEQGTFSYVGPANKCNNRFGHLIFALRSQIYDFDFRYFEQLRRPG
jgi:hypothetical protein